MLAPFSIKRIVKGLVERGVLFSVGTGALNHGNVKMFLADVHSYTVEREVIYCLRNYFQCHSKNSLEMLENARSVLKPIDITRSTLLFADGKGNTDRCSRSNVDGLWSSENMR